jgi:hypothetical protein|tara:strand:+ start:1446 stop:1964 length:519 start_codon:yes stop_codon:yes gene_type:complete
MAWEYLNDSRWNIRYKIISSYLKDKIKDKVILDINCGIPTLYNYLEGFSVYYANDIIPIEMVGDKLIFQNIKDEEVDIKSDVLMLLGLGGGEFLTDDPLESRTERQSLYRLSKYNPDYIIVETIQLYEERCKVMTIIKSDLKNYIIDYEIMYIVHPINDFYHKRMITMFKKK